MRLAPRSFRDVTVSASGFPVPRAAYCCLMPDRQNSLPLAPVRVALFPNQGPGVLTSTVWADGIVNNPPSQAIVAGDQVQFIPYSELLS